MRYTITFYKKEDYDDVKNLILASYQWESSVVGNARLLFSEAMTTEFNHYEYAWEHTVGVVREEGKVVACIWNEGEYDGCEFFLFDKKERSEDEELLKIMVRFAKTYGAGLKEDGRTRYTNLFIPTWNTKLIEYATEHGFKETEWLDECYVLPFSKAPFSVEIPEGYEIIDGSSSPDFYLSNVHMFSFNYGKGDLAADQGVNGFHRLRQCKEYNPKLDLCILDENKLPVAIALAWYCEGMRYCEMEPLAVAWWARRKGLATAIIHELSNRVMEMYPDCEGLRGGDQEFYKAIGFEKWGASRAYYWEKEIFISWDSRSKDQDYAKEIE